MQNDLFFYFYNNKVKCSIFSTVTCFLAKSSNLKTIILNKVQIKYFNKIFDFFNYLGFKFRFIQISLRTFLLREYFIRIIDHQKFLNLIYIREIDLFAIDKIRIINNDINNVFCTHLDFGYDLNFFLFSSIKSFGEFLKVCNHLLCVCNFFEFLF